jgi:hypothetical protein
MMKTDLFLKFTNKAEAEGVLTSIGAKIENGKIAPNASIYGFQTQNYKG